jgi:DNA invertase Pin-like site-specific DNA recombinase
LNVAYVRVSTVEQNEARQVEALEKYKIEKWYTEKVSAKDTNRPKLQEMIDFVREGDVIHIHDFSRLARSTRDLLNIVDLLNEKNVGLVSNKENLDTTTATGKLMLTVIAAINEFERNNLLERQREGIEIAKRKGKFKGRKKIDYPANWEEIINLYMKRKLTAEGAMKLFLPKELKRNTFYKLLNQWKEKGEE